MELNTVITENEWDETCLSGHKIEQITQTGGSLTGRSRTDFSELQL